MDPNVTELYLQGLDSRIRIFRAGDEVDTCAVVTDRYVVIVDTMSTPEMARAITAYLAQVIERRHLLVVNTHADYDHAWGNAAFVTTSGAFTAPIIGHYNTWLRLTGETDHTYLAEKQRAEPRFASVRLVAPTMTFTDRFSINGGDLTLQLFPTPGHTDDHVSLWVPELRLLIAGDATEHPFPYVGERAHLPTLRATLQDLAALQPEIVIPCHGGVSDSSLLERNSAYFGDLERHIRLWIDKHGAPDDWQRREDLAEVLDLPFKTAAQQQGADPATLPALYPISHRLAIRATLAGILDKNQDVAAPDRDIREL